jgi:hypothetical protein
MPEKFIFPTKILVYEQQKSEEVGDIVNESHLDESAEKNGSNPAFQRYLDSLRPKNSPISLDKFTEEIFSIKEGGDVSKEEADAAFLLYGGIVLKDSEAEKLGLTKKPIAAQISQRKRGLNL